MLNVQQDRCGNSKKWCSLCLRSDGVMSRRGVDIGASTAGVEVTLIDFTLSRLRTADGAGAFCDLAADPELFQGPRGDCQVSTSGLY